MNKFLLFLFAGLLVLSTSVLVAAENSNSDDQVDVFASKIFAALSNDSDEASKTEQAPQNADEDKVDKFATSVLSVLSQDDSVVVPISSETEKTPVEEESKENDVDVSENDDDTMSVLALEVLKIIKEDDAEKESQEAAEAEQVSTQDESIKESTQESAEETSDNEVDMADLAQEVANIFGDQKKPVQEESDTKAETDQTVEVPAVETTESDKETDDSIDIFRDQILKALEESENEESSDNKEEAKDETVQEEAEEETQEAPEEIEQTEETEEINNEEDIVELVSDLMKKMQEAEDKRKALSNPDVKDGNCAQEVSSSLETIYSFAHDAFEGDVTKIQGDFETLQTVTESVNEACYNSFSINMKPKTTSTETMTCLEVISAIANVVATFKNGDNSDVYNFARSVQSLWYQNEQFTASCIEAKPEEPEQVVVSEPEVEEEEEEEGDMISIDCLLSYAEGISVLYDISNDLKKLNIVAIKEHVNTLDAKVGTINSNCDARFNIETRVRWSFAEPTCEEDFDKLRDIISVFEKNNNGDIDFIGETIRKAKLIGDQIISDC